MNGTIWASKADELFGPSTIKFKFKFMPCARSTSTGRTEFCRRILEVYQHVGSGLSLTFFLRTTEEIELNRSDERTT